jgi:DNA-binding NarL/FixJ family response regulator
MAMATIKEFATKEGQPHAVDRTINLLIVEDEALVASYIQDVLEESGFTIAGVASTGPEALSLANDVRVDLALVDIKLAGPMDGIEVAKLLRERHDVPSIFLSGMHDPETMRRAQEVEPLGFLQKPFRPSQVFNALEKARAHITQT